MEWRIGCSGFSYGDWREIFYPEDLPQSEWLEHYARFFDCVELNVTFYRFPGLTFFKNLFDKTPDDFGFIVKAPKTISHIKQFMDVDAEIYQLYNIAKEGLRQKLRAFLFQLPPSFSFTKERMENIITHLDPTFINVVELRHSSWWTSKVYKEFSRNNITFCGVSYPSLPGDVIVNTPTPYYRFHGVPKLYYSMYEEYFLRKVADTIETNKKVTEGFLLFNNTATRAALENATYIQEYVELNRAY